MLFKLSTSKLTHPLKPQINVFVIRIIQHFRSMPLLILKGNFFLINKINEAKHEYYYDIHYPIKRKYTANNNTFYIHHYMRESKGRYLYNKGVK